MTPVRLRGLVLLVEDDAWIRTFITDVLSDEGYDVIEAADGRTGLRLAAEHAPDVVLLDLAMPEVTGVDVLHHLKRTPATQGVPVLILSAFVRVLPERDAASVAGVLTKPLDVSKLLAAVEDALNVAPDESNATTGPQLAEQLLDVIGKLRLA